MIDPLPLSIVLVNFRTLDLTLNCLTSIKENVKGIAYEIILVDNAPLVKHENQFRDIFPELIYRETNENIGFGRANNVGVNLATGKYVLLLNSDTLVLQDCIQRCYSFMENPANACIGLVGCKHLNADLSFQPSFYPFKRKTLWSFIITENPFLYKLYKVDEKQTEPVNPMEVEDISGSFLFLRKEVIEKVNAFDPDFFLYFEETEWCTVRINKYYKIYYLPDAQIVHFGGQSTPKQDFLFTQFRLSQGLYWYKKGWANYVGYIFYCYLNIIFLLLGLLFNREGSYFKKYIKAYADLTPYLLFDIPRYSSRYGSRKEMLIFKKAKKYFV
jgi:GT2 family glycosyltransferase